MVNKKLFRKNSKATAIAILLTTAILSGCSSSAAKETPASSAPTEEATTAEEGAATEDTATAEEGATTEDTATTEEDNTTEEETPSAASTEEALSETTTNTDDPDRALFQSYLDNKAQVDGVYFRDKFEESFEDFGGVQAYYYDVDEDGKDELLINELYYGFNIFDIKDGEIFLLTFGDGTSDFCSIYEKDGHPYIGHSDFSHSGRQYLDLSRYDADGNVTEQFTITAEYSDSETDQYDENSTFTYNGETITMDEYESYMNSFTIVDPENMEQAKFE